jgi:foldase protein PrsA
MKNKILFSSLIGAALLLLALAIFMLNKEDYVAKVGDVKISESEFEEALRSIYGQTVLDGLITDKIIAQEIEKNNIKVSQEEIDQKLQEYMETYGGEENFLATIEAYGMELADYEKEVERYLATNKLLEDRITITEEEMKTYFEENKDSFQQEEEVKASHILVSDLETANEVLEKLEAGEDFSELASKYSQDEANKDDGGNLGYFGKGEMVQEFEDAVFAMKVGDISEPVKTSYGYHIIRLDDKKEAKEAVFEEVKDEVREVLFEQKADDEYSNWLNEVKQDYDIEYKL